MASRDPLLQTDIIVDHYRKNGRVEAVLSALIFRGQAAKYFLHDDLSDVPPAGTDRISIGCPLGQVVDV